MSKLAAGKGIALVLAAGMATGCGSSHEPSQAVTGLTLVVHSSEWEAERNLVVVGEDASVEIQTLTDQGCAAEVPCPVSADVELRSSNPNVLSPAEQQVRTPDTVALVAHAPGTATVTVTTNGHTESKRVDVVAEPLPLDAIQVSPVTELNDLPAQYDAAHNLTWVEIPPGGWWAFDVRAFRSGAEVFGVSTYAYPYSWTMAEVSNGCRPVRIDRDCEVVQDFWIHGVNSGDVQIAVSVRNLSTEFTAHMP